MYLREAQRRRHKPIGIVLQRKNVAVAATLAATLLLVFGFALDHSETEVQGVSTVDPNTARGEKGVRREHVLNAPEPTPAVVLRPQDTVHWVECELGNNLSYQAEATASGASLKLNVVDGLVLLPSSATEATLSGVDGLWKLRLRNGHCIANIVNELTAIVEGTVLSAEGTPISGIRVRAQCEHSAGTTTQTTTRSSWEGYFYLQLPYTNPQDSCTISTTRGTIMPNEGVPVSVKLPSPGNSVFIELVAPALPSPISDDPELACQESAALRATVEVDPTDTALPLDPMGQPNYLEIEIRRMLRQLPPCGVADLNVEEQEQWLAWLNGRGPHPLKPVE
jgi:hypothetical protein